ncbi:MAG: hypothetical protein KKB37_11275 [Alphaproteobacteria bacterium]|nr:hypothetical protein [Alphaproteobacteria bacterium]
MVTQSMDIERLVTWALREQGLGWASADGRSLDVETLGTRVDKSVSYGLPPPGIGLNDNDDALAVRAAIDRLPSEAQFVVIIHGRIGSRPSWGEEGYGEPEQMLSGNGQPRWIYKDPENRRGKIGPMLDWRAYDAHVRQIDYERAAWTMWREALITLKRELADTLSAYIVTGPLLPARPWAGLEDKGPVQIPYAETLDARRDHTKWENARPSDTRGSGGAYSHLRPDAND